MEPKIHQTSPSGLQTICIEPSSVKKVFKPLLGWAVLLAIVFVLPLLILPSAKGKIEYSYPEDFLDKPSMEQYADLLLQQFAMYIKVFFDTDVKVRPTSTGWKLGLVLLFAAGHLAGAGFAGWGTKTTMARWKERREAKRRRQ